MKLQRGRPRGACGQLTSYIEEDPSGVCARRQLSMPSFSRTHSGPSTPVSKVWPRLPLIRHRGDAGVASCHLKIARH